MAIVEYNGHNMSPTIRERIASLILPSSQTKAMTGNGEAPLPAFPANYNLPYAHWSVRDARSYIQQGYKLNSAVFSVTRTLANAFAEPPLLVYTDETKKTPIPNHPIRKLIKRPNELMGEAEFWKYWLTYALTGGNAYGVVVPTQGGKPGEIWPYHDVVMWPVPMGNRWIDHYIYSIDGGMTSTIINTQEVIHFKYSVDPEFPWRGLPALAPVAREVDSDNELTRFLKALLQNDATPHGILTPPAGMIMKPDAKEQAKREWRLKFGRDNAGNLAVMDAGWQYTRVALNMNELAFDALRAVPEARIAAAYGVPAIVAGLNIGLARSTYSNYEEARKAFTEQTLVPLWRAVASEFQQSLVPLFGNDVYVDFDLSEVRALAESNDSKHERAIDAYNAGLFTMNEARAQMGMDPVDGPEGDEFKAPPPAPVAPTPPNTQNAQNAQQEPPQEQAQDAAQQEPPTPPTKALKGVERKDGGELPKRAQAIEARMRSEVKAELDRVYTGIAERVDGGH